MNFNPDLNQIRAFWQQIEQTLDQLLESELELQFDADGLLDTYRASLQKIDRNLTFHFEREHEAGPVEMIFGCDGYPESIHAVLSVVGAAPEISGINFVPSTTATIRYPPVSIWARSIVISRSSGARCGRSTANCTWPSTCTTPPTYWRWTHGWRR